MSTYNDKVQHRTEGNRHRLNVGWRTHWFGIRFPDLARADVRVVAVSAAIVAASMIVGAAVVWSRVSTLWG